MLDCLETFELYGVGICFLKNNESYKITINMPDKEISYEQKVSFLVINDYFKKFLDRDMEAIYENIELITRIKRYSRDDNILDIAVPLFCKFFKNYILEFEMEIACDIEREKSPFYATKYGNK